MPAGRKRRSPTWQQSLLLLIAGVVVGYPSCIGASHGMWSGDVSQFRGLYIIAFLAGAMAFLSGFIGFVEIAVRAVTSPIESGTAVAVPRPDHAATDQISTHNVVQRRRRSWEVPLPLSLASTLRSLPSWLSPPWLLYGTGDGPRLLQATDDIIGLIGSSLCC
jgi:hypothetical protein